MIKAGFYLATGCFGCEASLLDLLPEVPEFNVVWAAPTLGNGKYDEIPKMDVVFVEGCVKSNENECIVKLLRKRSKIFVALGTCACFGGIPGLANLHSKEEIFETVFKRSLTTVGESYPQKTVLVDGKYELSLPELYENVKPLSKVVKVDIFVPGCPPSEDNLNLMFEFVKEKRKGWVINGKSVCESCPYELEGLMSGVNRVHEMAPNTGECFIARNVLCFGPATIDCGAFCTKAGVPCRGCFGPVAGKDHGAKIIDFLSVVMNEKAVEELEAKYHSLAKIFYTYTLPSALICEKVRRYHVRDIG